MIFHKCETDFNKLFSNKKLAEYLDTLHWTKAHNDRNIWEWVKLRQIKEDNAFMHKLLTDLGRIKLGKYIYDFKNSRAERYNPKVIPTKPVKKDKVVNLGPYDFDLEKKGVVTKIE